MKAVEAFKRIREYGAFIQFMTFFLVIATVFWFAGRFSAPAVMVDEPSAVKVTTSVEVFRNGSTHPATRTVTTEYFKPEAEEPDGE